MDPDKNVCFCYRVSLRKIRAFLEREDPPKASLISECLGAGTGCQWCVPYLAMLHEMHRAGCTPDLDMSPEGYAAARARYRKTGRRDTPPEDPSSADSPPSV